MTDNYCTIIDGSCPLPHVAELEAEVEQLRGKPQNRCIGKLTDRAQKAEARAECAEAERDRLVAELDKANENISAMAKRLVKAKRRAHEAEFNADRLATEKNKPVPWDDCKIAFSTDLSMDGLCDYLDENPVVWPKGWEFDEYDDSGARAVVVFRVDGAPTKLDGDMVVKLLEDGARAALNGTDGGDKEK